MEEHGAWSGERIRDMIGSIKWGDYETGCGDAKTEMCAQMLELFSDNQAAAMEAGRALWNSLCHRAQTVPAVLPAYEILLAGLQS